MIQSHRRGLVDEYTGFAFARPSLAWDRQGRLYHPHNARFENRGVRRGALIEEAATNLLLHSDAFENWSLSRGIVVPNVEMAPDGQLTADKWEVNATGENSLGQTIAGVENGVYTLSVFAKKGNNQWVYALGGDGAGNGVRLWVDLDNKAVGSAVSFGNGWTATARVEEAPNGYLRLVVSFQSGAGTNKLFRWGLSAGNGSTSGTAVGQYVFLWRAQVENKSYPTSSLPGGQARAAETLTIPTAGVLSPTQGTIEMLVYVDAVARRQGTSNVMFQIPQANISNGGGIFIQHSPNSAFWFLRCYNDAVVLSEVSIADSYTPDGWHHFLVAWDAASAIVEIDGVQHGVINNPNLPTGFASRASLLHRANVVDHLNSLIAYVRTHSTKRTGLYNANQPPTWDANTTLLLPLQGPDNQRAARATVL